MGTLFTLAECEAKGGMIASAVSHYDEYLRLFSRLTTAQKATQAGREKVSAAQKAALTPQVPYVTLIVRDAPSGTTVKWDDMVFHVPALGVPLPVNPGDHVVTTLVPGGASVVTRVRVEKAERKQIELKTGPLSVGPAKTSPQPTVAPAPSPTDSASAATGSPESDAGTSSESQKIWMYGAGGLGAAGLVIGSITGAMVLGKKGTIDDNCDGTRCNAAGKEAADGAQSLGLVSTIGFGVGIVGLATAVVLLVTEAKPSSASRTWSPLVADRSGGVVLGLERRW
jgi:hypothetical protein